MITVVIGTRAQQIKMAPVLRELEQRKIRFKYISTGQHQETMADLGEAFAIKTPAETWHDGGEVDGIAKMTTWFFRVLARLVSERKRLSAELGKDAKNIIVVHGDTVSTLLGAILGKIIRIKVAHVESGLRSFNLFHPFPEELIRLLVFRLSDIGFCPNKWAVENLKKYKLQKIDTGGNTILDAVDYAIQVNKNGKVSPDLHAVVSIHRFENLYSKSRLSQIVNIVENAARTVRIIFVLHPATKKRLQKFGLMERLAGNERIELLPRMGYLQFLNLAYKSEYVITDGGSNQEEMSYLGVPVLLLRKATERTEGMGDNVVLSGYDQAKITQFLDDYHQYRKERPRSLSVSPSKIIVDELASYA